MTRNERAAISILNAYKVGYESGMEDLEQEPSVTQKSGKWKREEFPNFTVAWFCNKCGRGSYRKSNYCPNCGARMESDGE